MRQFISMTAASLALMAGAVACSPSSNDEIPQEREKEPEVPILAASPESAADAATSEDQSNIQASAPAVGERPAAFAQCAACHTDNPDQKSSFGPNLFGLAGKKAGMRSDYAYSPAMKNSAIVWNAETLDAFIKAPQELVPGTRMAAAGVRDEASREQIVGYILNLK